MKYTFDSREVRPGMGFVALKGERSDGHDFIPQALAAGAADVIDGLEELQKRAKERRQALKARVVGVTGSAGKTTTKELLRAFLSKVGKTAATEGNFNNHIGLPLTILNCPDDAEFLVLEMGTNHPGEIAALCDIAAPDLGLVTNVGTAHLEFFKTREGIAAEKGTLLRRAGRAFASAETFAFERLGAEEGKRVVVDVGQAWMRQALQGVLPGEHNVANACLAFAVAESLGCTRGQAVAALADFALPGARWRKSEKNGVTFIDDTYNANPDSMVAALDALAGTPCAGRRVALLGDMFELGADALELHRRVFAHAMALRLPLVVGVGEMSSQCVCHLAYKTVGEMRRKVGYQLSAGDVVLLKASHSMKLGDVLTEGLLGLT